MTILEKIDFEEDWLLEVNPTKANIQIAFDGIRATVREAQTLDAVSREAALLALTGMDLPTDRDKLIALFTERIQHLPSVTPKGVTVTDFADRCRECGRIELSEDAISREEVQDLISRWLSDYLLDETREALETINYKVGDMPAVYPERPKGKWVEHPHERGLDWEYSMFECSECHVWADSDSDYCPNCGSYNGGGENGDSN